MEEIVSTIAMRPVTFFILLTLVVLLLPSILIPYWYHMMEKIEENVDMEVSFARDELITKVEDAAKLRLLLNSSAINLARILHQVICGEELTFYEIQTKVAPTLFQAQLIIPSAIQASYIGLDGIFFSYFKNGDQIFATYSNATFSNSTDHYTWYSQPVNSSGGLIGEPKIRKPSNLVNEPWFKKAMANTNGSSSIGQFWSTGDGKEVSSLFLDSARLDRAGLITVGFPVKGVVDFLASTNLLGASLYMESLDDGYVLINALKEAKIQFHGAKALVQNSNQVYVGEIPCKSSNGAGKKFVGTTLGHGESSSTFYCSTIDIANVSLGYVLAFPRKGIVDNVHNHTKVAFILLTVMMVAMVISILAFVTLIMRAARREVHLCAAYIREMERTAQAERKSMKQSLAFASANHDVRGYLACIKGLIDLCYSDLPPSSEVASNMKKIETCAEDLLALVNSILDFNKIEAEKMQLEESNFDLAQFLEDIVDLHHPIAMKKGVEVILDPCDGSISKFTQVKGDRGKLKQILSNLLSNAIKFTSQGHISIRCHVKKPSLENSIIASNKRNLFINRLSRFFYKNKRAYDDLEEIKTIKQDPSCMEFEFEVEDTGPGIPRDKRHCIFENFVQVKENSAGKTGTGLGLGIVQSLVRLMGGDIEVVDKPNGEQGTCFKFNIFLLVKEITASLDNPRQEEPELKNINQTSGFSTCVRSPRFERSLVVLLIRNDARRGIVQRYMESLGINLEVLIQSRHLSSTLKKIKFKLIEPHSYNSSSGGSDLSPPRETYMGSSSDCCRPNPKFLPLNLMDGHDDVLPVYKRSKIRGPMRCILLLIDCNAGDDFQQVQRLVAEFRKDLYMTCIKVVWLDRADTRKAHFQGLQNESLPSTDHIMLDPLHGSRLSWVIRLLPEFGGDLLSIPGNVGRSSKRSNIVQTDTDREMEKSSGEEIKPFRKKRNSNSAYYSDDSSHEQHITRVLRSSSSDKPIQQPSMVSSKLNRDKPMPKAKTKITEISKQVKKESLEGLKFLIVEDHLLQRKLAESCVARLGAECQTCGNGKEALEMVCKALCNISSEGSSKFPYDFILMDCQMPVMNGFEATKRIREEEKKYGIHIPIIALTAHEVEGEESKKIVEAGMDFLLTKPLQQEKLLELIHSL